MSHIFLVLCFVFFLFFSGFLFLSDIFLDFVFLFFLILLPFPISCPFWFLKHTYIVGAATVAFGEIALLEWLDPSGDSPPPGASKNVI